jgi:hypothetical protein
LKGKEGYMALKLDMSKTYDRVEWHFLEAMMHRLGFEDRWIHLIMRCVKTVSYSILIKGQPQGRILPTRGIRQGDPFSPYLVLLCVEGLSTLLHRVELRNDLSGLPISRQGTKLNYLFFADDSLLFCKANLTEWNKIQEVLEVYERASGQKINRDKTSIFFSKNTKEASRDQMLAVSGVSSTSYEKYLGLPALVGRSHTQSFQNIQSRVCDKLNGWKERFLSQAGNEVFLKAVIQVMPTYTMSVFQLPKTLCKRINSLVAKFWWGHKENLSKIAWLK